VVKPSVSASARDTARWQTREQVFDHVRELVAAGRTAMVRPYLASVDVVLAHVAQRFGADAVLYARVDVIDGPDGHPMLLELELTEPSLFLPVCDGAADRLADAISARVRVPRLSR
jgi:hypothetical protein